MRTESVDSLVADILNKAVQAKKHLEEAVAGADTLPATEGREIREILDPAQNHLRTSVGRLQKWLETPPA